MKATKYILFILVTLLGINASAVEYGQYQPVYQTSNVRMTTIGSYGSGMSSGTSYSSSFRSTSSMSASGSAYAPSVSMPFARTRRSVSTGFMSADDNLARALQPTPSSSQSSYKGIGRRRAPGVTGEEEPGDTQTDGDGTWTWNGTTWVLEGAPTEGDTKVIDGEVWVYRDGSWVLLDDQDGPNTPVGSIPWLLMVLLVGAYAYRHKKEVI